MEHLRYLFISSIHLLHEWPLPLFPAIFSMNVFCTILYGGRRVNIAKQFDSCVRCSKHGFLTVREHTYRFCPSCQLLLQKKGPQSAQTPQAPVPADVVGFLDFRPGSDSLIYSLCNFRLPVVFHVRYSTRGYSVPVSRDQDVLSQYL